MSKGFFERFVVLPALFILFGKGKFEFVIKPVNDLGCESFLQAGIVRDDRILNVIRAL